ncbi:hypothetical protein ACLKA6_010348 [Drosophila palustris]
MRTSHRWDLVAEEKSVSEAIGLVLIRRLRERRQGRKVAENGKNAGTSREGGHGCFSQFYIVWTRKHTTPQVVRKRYGGL